MRSVERNVVSGSGKKPNADQVDYGQNTPMPLPKHPEATQTQEHHALTLQFATQWLTYTVIPDILSLQAFVSHLEIPSIWGYIAIPQLHNNPEPFLRFFWRIK